MKVQFFRSAAALGQWAVNTAISQSEEVDVTGRKELQ